jgi:hypothetical protein
MEGGEQSLEQKYPQLAKNGDKEHDAEVEYVQKFVKAQEGHRQWSK